MSRGMKNNNPGNVRRSATKYKGETEGADPLFKTFETMAWGYRAMFVLLSTYQRKYGLNTITGLIGRWAPPVENDTNAYISAVSKLSGIPADALINTLHKDTMIPIVSAMSRMENGVKAVSADVWDGWDLFIKYRL